MTPETKVDFSFARYLVYVKSYGVALYHDLAMEESFYDENRTLEESLEHFNMQDKYVCIDNEDCLCVSTFYPDTKEEEILLTQFFGEIAKNMPTEG